MKTYQESHRYQKCRVEKTSSRRWAGKQSNIKGEYKSTHYIPSSVPHGVCESWEQEGKGNKRGMDKQKLMPSGQGRRAKHLTIKRVESKRNYNHRSRKEHMPGRLTPLQMLESRPIAHPFHAFKEHAVRKGRTSCQENESYINIRASLPREHLDYTVATSTDNPAAVTAPDGGTHSLTTHQPVTRDFLSAAPLLEIPEPQAGIMTRRD